MRTGARARPHGTRRHGAAGLHREIEYRALHDFLTGLPSLVLLADSLIRYNNGEGSVWEIGLNLLGVVPGGRLLTALGKVAGLSAVGTRVVTATSRGLAAGRATVVEMSQSVRMGFASRLAFMGDETGCCRRGRRTDSAHCGAITSTWTTGLGTRPMSQAARPAWKWTRLCCDPVYVTRSSRGVLDVSVSQGIKADTSSEPASAAALRATT